MNKRQRMIVSIACALLVMALFVLYASRVRGEADRERTEMLKRYGGEVVSIAVARHTIETGEVASTSNVDFTDWVASLVPEDALLSLDDVVGREVTIPVAEGVPLTELNFRDASELVDIPAGHVAIAIPATDQLGLAAGITPGSHVMAYVIANGTAMPVSDDVTVLMTPSASGSAYGRGSLTLAVTAEDVSTMLTSSSAGSLRLVVPANDAKRRQVDPVAPLEVPPVRVGDAESPDAHETGDDQSSEDAQAEGEGA